MPALLLQDMRWYQRIQHRIHVDIDQVIIVLQVLAGDRIAGFIRIGESIQESIERAFDQLDERLLHWIFA